MRWCGLVVLSVVCSLCCCVSGVAFGLSQGHEFELVSPVYKGGFGATHIEAVAVDGESVAFFSPGVIAGAPSGLSGLDTLAYLARRGTSEWSTVSLVPPDVLMPYVLDRDVSTSLSSTLALGKPGRNLEAAFQESTEEAFMVHSTSTPNVSANWPVAGIVLETVNKEPLRLHYRGGSGDFCHLLFTSFEFQHQAMIPKAEGTTGQVYELDAGCNGQPASVRVVALDNEENVISPLCRVDVGIETYDSPSNSFNAISNNGTETLFTTCVKNAPEHHQLFVRLDGRRTLEVSRPLSEECGEDDVPCGGAVARANSDFAGASEDGSRVFFTTTAPLVGEDNDMGNDLYMASIGCPSGGVGCAATDRRVTSLVEVSHVSTGGSVGDVQGVVKVAPDGRRVYFVARGLLGEGLNADGNAPVNGADNLYVFDSVLGRVLFIGDLCSGLELSGVVEDPRCPSKTGVDTGLWSSQGIQAQTADTDGRFIVFSTYAQLTSDDADPAKDVYRYDAVTGVLDRVSVGEAGYDTNGSNSAFDASITAAHSGTSVLFQHELDSRAISEGGSSVVFTTADPLSPSATNGLVNVYEWHEEPGGKSDVSLISSGSGETPVENVVIAPEGNDVFFVTTEGLVSQDVDGAPDVYDARDIVHARVPGGFPPSPLAPEPCSSDACQGPLMNPAPMLVPATTSQPPEHHTSQGIKAKTLKSKKHSKAPGRKEKRRTKNGKRKRTLRRGKTPSPGGQGR